MSNWAKEMYKRNLDQYYWHCQPPIRVYLDIAVASLCTNAISTGIELHNRVQRDQGDLCELKITDLWLSCLMCCECFPRPVYATGDTADWEPSTVAVCAEQCVLTSALTT